MNKQQIITALIAAHDYIVAQGVHVGCVCGSCQMRNQVLQSLQAIAATVAKTEDEQWTQTN